MDDCFESIKTIEVRSRVDNAWSGSITVTVNGKEKQLDCSGCTGNVFNRSLVVGWKNDGSKLAETKCKHKESCVLTFAGKLSYLSF